MPNFFAVLARFAKVILLSCIALVMLQLFFFPSFINLLILSGLITVLITLFLGS